MNEVEEELGYTFLCGIEPEMMWLKNDRRRRTTPEGVTKPWCYHINQFEELRPVILDVVAYGKALGLDTSYGDHEDAPGPARAQLPLRPRRPHGRQHHDLPADLRRRGRKHGAASRRSCRSRSRVSRRTAHHHHFTLVDEDGNNVFYDPDGPAQLSEIGLRFMGGILDHSGALSAIRPPTVNSYKRMWDFGFWAPIYKNYGWQNRTCTVRVASGGRFEFRGVDSSCNPYLTQAALLTAGLDGIRRELDPGPPQQRNTYDLLAEGEEFERVPDHLGAALDALAADEVVRSSMPGRLYDVFMHYKRDEWERYLAAVTDWEREEYLEVLP